MFNPEVVWKEKFLPENNPDLVGNKTEKSVDALVKPDNAKQMTNLLRNDTEFTEAIKYIENKTKVKDTTEIKESVNGLPTLNELLSQYKNLPDSAKKITTKESGDTKEYKESEILSEILNTAKELWYKELKITEVKTNKEGLIFELSSRWKNWAWEDMGISFYRGPKESEILEEYYDETGSLYYCKEIKTLGK